MAKFEIGNKAAKKEPKVVLRKFKDILNNTLNDNNILCWQDACLSIGWRVTKCDYWADKYTVFGIIKKEVHQIVISRVNNKALKGDFNPSQSIWRQKQCGERDTQYQEVNSTVQQTNIISLGKGKKPD